MLRTAIIQNTAWFFFAALPGRRIYHFLSISACAPAISSFVCTLSHIPITCIKELYRLFKPEIYYKKIKIIQFSSLAQSCLTSWPYGLWLVRLPCPSSSPGACSNSCPLSWWCYPTNSSSVAPFSSCLQSFPSSGSFPMSQFFASHGQSIGASASASVLSINIQDWFPLGLTGWIAL